MSLNIQGSAKSVAYGLGENKMTTVRPSDEGGLNVEIMDSRLVNLIGQNCYVQVNGKSTEQSRIRVMVPMERCLIEWEDEPAIR